jgi:hypothetical protein
LGRLAAYIAFDLKAAIQSNGVQASVHLESLSEWHRTLPPPMQLSRLSIADPYDLDWHSKRSLLQLHIIFLGLFIEPYRDGLVDLARSRLGDATLNPEDFEALHHLEEQCILAARQSARVTSLLQINDLIRSHCWVAMYVCSKRPIQKLTQDIIVVTLASLAVRLLFSLLRRNYSSYLGKKLVKTYPTQHCI